MKSPESMTVKVTSWGTSPVSRSLATEVFQSITSLAAITLLVGDFVGEDLYLERVND